jgi:enterochelin esterase-like enzyme
MSKQDLLQSNRKMHKLLEQKGYEVTYREYNGGHNYTSWRDDLWCGLVHWFW